MHKYLTSDIMQYTGLLLTGAAVDAQFFLMEFGGHRAYICRAMCCLYLGTHTQG